MTFRFETDYDLETLTAMAKGIRRTVRKKRSCLVHIFAALVVLMEAFFPLMDLRKNALDVGDVLALKQKSTSGRTEWKVLRVGKDLTLK